VRYATAAQEHSPFQPFSSAEQLSVLMKITRYSEPQILAILRQAEGGVPVSELCREHAMSNASFYKWRSKYGGMDASMISQMKALEDQNQRLRKMYAEMSMQAELLKEALGKK
jgi:putative transposase